ncbi:MAG: rod shape-determining protein MreD [Lactobacillales bacterium]|jgi:rod shape-determining protein MreD|nr:rod shape-determining protein MreD [Lactobacillales bacterium]
MIARKNIKRLMPIIVFVLFLLDSHLTNIMDNLTEGHATIHINLLVAMIVAASCVVDEYYMLIITIILSVFFDLYFVGFVGVFAVAVPLTTFLIYRARQYNPKQHVSAVSEIFLYIVAIFCFEFITMFVQALYGVSVFSISEFVNHILGYTVIVNALLFFLVFPLFKFMLVRDTIYDTSVLDRADD